MPQIKPEWRLPTIPNYSISALLILVPNPDKSFSKPRVLGLGLDLLQRFVLKNDCVNSFHQERFFVLKNVSHLFHNVSIVNLCQVW